MHSALILSLKLIFPLLYCFGLEQSPQQSCPVQVFYTLTRSEVEAVGIWLWWHLSASHQATTVHRKWRQISLQILCHFSFPVSLGKDRERKREDSSPDREEFRRTPPRCNFFIPFFESTWLLCKWNFEILCPFTAASSNKFIMKIFFFCKTRIWYLFTHSTVEMNQSLFLTWQ